MSFLASASEQSSAKDRRLLLTLLSCMAVIFPFGIYCLIIARLNSRPHPVLVWGVWDFATVVLAVSGLLLYVGPGLMTGFSAPWRDVWLELNYRSLRHIPNPGPGSWTWTGLWYSYFALLAGGLALASWQRRKFTAIYNVEAASLAACLAQALDRLQYSWERVGSQFHIDPQPSLSRHASVKVMPAAVLAGIAESDAEGEPPIIRSDPTLATSPNGDRPAVVELYSFAAMRHVTLRWRCERDSLRRAVEKELSESLAQVRSGRSRTAAWLRGIALASFLALFLFTMYVQIIRVNAEGL